MQMRLNDNTQTFSMQNKEPTTMRKPKSVREFIHHFVRPILPEDQRGRRLEIKRNLNKRKNSLRSGAPQNEF